MGTRRLRSTACAGGTLRAGCGVGAPSRAGVAVCVARTRYPSRLCGSSGHGLTLPLQGRLSPCVAGRASRCGGPCLCVDQGMCFDRVVALRVRPLHRASEARRARVLVERLVYVRKSECRKDNEIEKIMCKTKCGGARAGYRVCLCKFLSCVWDTRGRGDGDDNINKTTPVA